MKTEELFERADKRIAEAEDIKKSRRSIEDIENINAMLRNEITVIKLQQGTMEKQLDMALELEEYEEFQRAVESKMNEFLMRRSIKLEQLLGITPKIINPEFEAAARDMEKSTEHKVDPVVDKLTEVLQGEAMKIEDKQVPLKPSEILEQHAEEIEKMYKVQMDTVGSIAEKFGVKKTDVNTFLAKHKLFRTIRKDDGFLDAKVHARQSKG